MRILVISLILAVLCMPQAGSSETTIIIAHPLLSGIVAAQQAIVAPNDERRVTIHLTAQRPLWALVVAIHLTSPIAVEPAALDTACAQSNNGDRGGPPSDLWCQFYNVSAGDALTMTLTMTPIHVTTIPISAACTQPLMEVGTPLSIYANGEAIVSRQTVWSPYRPGYCTFFPLLPGPA